jgi:quercetin dioxygenase-like cupin family protein
MTQRDRARMRVIAGVMTLGVCLGLMVGQRAPAAAQSNFVGGDPSRPDATDIRSSRLRFEAGSRSNWHSHGNWQIIMAEEGRGRTQVRGEPLQELVPGTPVHAGPGVVHWHGAAPDQFLVQLTFVSGQTSWQGPVSDADYLGR